MNYLSLVSLLIALYSSSDAFSIRPKTTARLSTAQSATVPAASTTAAPITAHPFIDETLRRAAMKLHTREQAPKEGKLQGPERPPYTPNLEDYLSFLVDSQHVYRTFEEIVNTTPELAPFRDTGLERTQPLEKDIEYLVTTYRLSRPDVGEPGRTYAELLYATLSNSIPAFVCHYYNHYFAHTAGGRMIGKKMSSLLLNGTTLEFYKVCMLTLFSR